MNSILVLLVCFCFPLKIHTEGEHALLTDLNTVLNVRHSHKINTEVQTFKELLQKNRVFIDKTLAIKAIINTHEKAVTITRPAKWGKSVTLHMIKDFLELPMTVDGIAKNVTLTAQYRLFHHGEVTFDNGEVKKLKNPLLITEDKEFLERYQGKHPVIYLTFKNVTWTNDCAQLRKQIETLISDIFVEHYYLLLLLQENLDEYEDDTNKLGAGFRTIEDVKTFKKIMYSVQLSAIELAQSVRFLCRLLFHFFDKHIYIFIDDYDQPVTEILKQRRFSNEEKEFLEFFQSFLGQTFQENEVLAKGILVGILPIASHSYTTHTSINGQLVEFFGFFGTDVGFLLNYYNHSLEESDHLIDWYGGYKTNMHKSHVSFNPWSIIQFLNTNKTEAHWIKCENNDYIGKLIQCNPSIRNLFIRLVKKQTVSFQIPDKKGLTEPCLEALQPLINPPYASDCNETLEEIFLSFLIAKGHVTVVPDTLRSYRLEVQLPNLEIGNELRKELILFYKNSYNIRNFTLECTAEYLYNFAGNDQKTSENLKITFQRLLNSFPSFQDISKNSSLNDTFKIEEALMHSIVDIIAMQISIKHQPNDVEIIVDDPLARGYIIMYLRKPQRGVIVKFKYNDESATKAFKQTKKHKPILHEFHLLSMKFIGINVMSNKTVNIFAQPMHFRVVGMNGHRPDINFVVK